ncbi:MAG TPA: hypothetical protein VFL91_16700 [Thermomicrobiales bacterium]|nr:hypothetical protein [Thermomicrobiales bacterium]
MLRLSKTTRLAPQEALRRARAAFGPGGDLGLAVARSSWNEVVFEGGGGGVAVTALPRAGDLRATEVTVVSREFDAWAARYLRDLPGA